LPATQSLDALLYPSARGPAGCVCCGCLLLSCRPCCGCCWVRGPWLLHAAHLHMAAVRCMACALHRHLLQKLSCGHPAPLSAAAAVLLLLCCCCSRRAPACKATGGKQHAGGEGGGGVESKQRQGPEGEVSEHTIIS
jgi:hypothetical protein